MNMNAALPEEYKIVNILTPQHAGAVTGDYVCLKNYHKAYFIFTFGQSGAANTQDIHLYAATDVAGTGGVVDQILYNYWTLDASPAGLLLTDALVKGAAGVTLLTTTASEDGVFVIEVDPMNYAADLDCYTIHADASNAANWMSCICLLGPARFGAATPPTAITD